jgi:hypothetical protein
MDVVREVQQALLHHQPMPLAGEVLAALTHSEHLMESVQRWKKADDVYDGVHALLWALDRIIAPTRGVGHAREMLRAMLLVAGDLLLEQFLPRRSPLESPHFVMIVDNEAPAVTGEPANGTVPRAATEPRNAGDFAVRVESDPSPNSSAPLWARGDVRPARMMAPASSTHFVDHDHFIAHACSCRTREGARTFVREVHEAILCDQPMPLTDDVRAAAAHSQYLAENVQLYKNAVRMDEGVHALLGALDKIVTPTPGVEQAREMLRAMLLETSSLRLLQLRGESFYDPDFVMAVEKERRGRVWR